MAKNEKDKQTNNCTQKQHRKLKTEQQEPHQKLGDLRCSGRVSRSCSTCGTHRVDHVITNPVNSLIHEKGRGL